MQYDMPTVGRMAPEWVDFLIMAGAIMLVALGALIWVFFIRKPKRRRRKYHHHHDRRLPNPTLAQNRGLPPIRQTAKPPEQQMPTSKP